MICKCEKCGKEFRGEYAMEECQSHELFHIENDTPPIADKPYVVKYDVLEADSDDYSSIALRNVETGREYHDGATNMLLNTNINIVAVKQLIGKRIKITSNAEIIEK